MTKVSCQKLKYLENEEKLLRWNKKHYSSFLKGFQMKQTKEIFLGGQSSTLMSIFLKHLRLTPNISKLKGCKIFTKLVPSQTPS